MANHGGKRKGAGRKPSAPTVVYQLRVDKQLVERIKSKHSTKEINNLICELLRGLDCRS